ncbi:UNVERIFIED_CONTAM: hypothetical protein Sradi_3912600 [Sesamum radiatum]|uniref:Uncharacterized protein n=1 Tax=Sesamum radiatum TaxID=300843 RepID=A0AAW2PI01_SESRA
MTASDVTAVEGPVGSVTPPESTGKSKATTKSRWSPVIGAVVVADMLSARDGN